LKTPFLANSSQYVVAVIILLLLGGTLILGILLLRPQVDVPSVVGQVTGYLAPTIAGVLAFMKSQETHLMVNSRLDDFISARSDLSRAEGIAQGTTDTRLAYQAEGRMDKPEVVACTNAACPLHHPLCTNVTCPLYRAEAGAQGIQGIQGETGVQGETGAAGPVGPAG
jgi:hypothetical protein